MPRHFNSLTELNVLISEHHVIEVMVTQEDYDFISGRVQPVSRLVDHIMLGQTKIRPELCGTMDLTGTEITIIKAGVAMGVNKEIKKEKI